MNLHNVQVGDTLECNKKGRRFFATVVEKHPHNIIIDPPKGITWRTVSAREVIRKV